MYLISCICIKTHLGDTFSHRESIAYYGGVNTISLTFLVRGGEIISKLRRLEYCSFIGLYSYFVFFCVICAFVSICKVIRKFLKKKIFSKKWLTKFFVILCFSKKIMKNITKFNRQDFRLFLHYLIPSLMGMILISAYTFADGFVLGQKLGEDALGALGIVTPALMFAFSIGSMFGLGGGSIYSIYLGKSEIENANKIFSTSFVCTLVNVLFLILGLIFVAEIGVMFVYIDKVL